MKKSLLFFFLFVFIFSTINAQRYLVRFKDKGSSSYTLANPSQYLSQRAIDRRLRFSIDLDSTDLPVTQKYMDSIASVPGVSILNASKWLNQVSILVTDANALTKINSFPFVLISARIASRLRTEVVPQPAKQWETPTGQTVPSSQRLTTDFFSYGNSFGQIHLHNGEFLHNIGLRGQNVVIGMLDAGFRDYTSVTGFDSARNNGQILGTWDFVAGNASVAEDHSHGEECLSIIAGNIPGTFVGSAPKANFYLFKTEDTFSEYPIEEHNWVCGAEKVDSAGGDLISSSLGYRTFDDPGLNHTYSQMDGNTTMAAIGADLAAKKGILVVCAVGNDGSNGWHYVLTPADGDSVMAVGAVNVAQQVWPNSSYGPSADGQVKPDVASVGFGTILQYSNNAVGGGSGTSYACPNMAGLAACLMQGFPEFNNMKIINAIRQAGNNVNTPNDRIGYGIPDMKKAVMSLIKDFASVSASITNCQASISWSSKDMGAMKYEIERKGPNETSFTKISEIAGTGTTFANHNYTIQDVLYGLSPGTAFYRIKQIIDTATSSLTGDYIDSISIEVNSLCMLNDLNVLLNTLKQTATSSATFADCNVLLKWSSSDMAGMKYEIERKTVTESSFKKIGETSGSGVVFATHNYQIYDNLTGVPAGAVMYRIKQIVDTSTISLKADYIDTTVVEVSPSCELTDLISLSPNPANDKFVLQTTIARPIQQFVIQITNSIGQTVSVFNKTKNSGIVNYTLPVPHLASGKYYVSVYENSHLLATKPLLIIK
jgi:subtilisin family serine protease